jgi:hypothetical protein
LCACPSRCNSCSPAARRSSPDAVSSSRRGKTRCRVQAPPSWALAGRGNSSAPNRLQCCNRSRCWRRSPRNAAWQVHPYGHSSSMAPIRRRRCETWRCYGKIKFFR